MHSFIIGIDKPSRQNKSRDGTEEEEKEDVSFLKSESTMVQQKKT